MPATLRVVKTYPFKEGIRPTVITADEKTMYAQLSYLNGVVRFDLTTGSIVKTLEEPFSTFAKANYPTPDDYPHDSAHHGLAMSGDGLACATRERSTIRSPRFDRHVGRERTIDVGMIPYWATTSADGLFCLVSLSGTTPFRLSTTDAREVTRVNVGKFPQRNRLGRVHESTLRSLQQ